jgi:hypothetical protein
MQTMLAETHEYDRQREFTDPLEGAIALALEFKGGTWQRRVVDLLIAGARGRENAKTVDWIIAGLEPEFGQNRRWSNDIQHKVIKVSRKSGTACFICSCRKGYYLALTKADTEPMMDFYTERLAQETINRAALQTFASSLP